jgi:hypothetical protein
MSGSEENRKTTHKSPHPWNSPRFRIDLSYSVAVRVHQWTSCCNVVISSRKEAG